MVQIEIDRRVGYVRKVGSWVLIPLWPFLLAAPSYAATASVTYTYDLVGRVATSLYDNGVCVVYSYDPVGNRTAQTNTLSGSPVTPVWGTGTWGCFKWTP